MPGSDFLNIILPNTHGRTDYIFRFDKAVKLSSYGKLHKPPTPVELQHHSRSYSAVRANDKRMAQQESIFLYTASQG